MGKDPILIGLAVFLVIAANGEYGAMAQSTLACRRAAAEGTTETVTGVISVAASHLNSSSDTTSTDNARRLLEASCTCPCACPTTDKPPTPSTTNNGADNSYCTQYASWSQSDAAKEDEMLRLVNQARSTGRSCGSRGYFPPVGPLSYNRNLRCSARKHAKDMAVRNYFSHNALDTGEDAGSRMKKAGYAWRTWGENIAAGYDTAQMTYNQWLASDGHCSNIMSANFKDLGVGFFPNPSSTYRNYWVQNFGAR